MKVKPGKPLQRPCSHPGRPVYPAFLLALVLMIVFLLAGTALGDSSRWYVNDDAPGPTHDGLTWATAFTDLQDALSAAVYGDEIWVAAGTYKPTDGTDRTISFTLKDGVALYGGFAGTEEALEQRDWLINLTTLSGALGAGYWDDSWNVVYAEGVSSTAVLDGFTVRNGWAGGISDPTGLHYRGGGMHNSGGSPTLANIIFTYNSAYLGGGMYNSGGSPSLTNVTFAHNLSYAVGGGMYNSGGSANLTNVSFFENDALLGSGGGMANAGGSPSIWGSVFSENSAEYLGGGMYNLESSPDLVDVYFYHNTSPQGGGMYNQGSSPSVWGSVFVGNWAEGLGGGMYNVESSPNLTNVVLSQNGASLHGGGMYNWHSSPMLTNVSVFGNGAWTGGGIYSESESSAILVNCILYGDADCEILDDSSLTTVSYSIVWGGWPGEGNLSVFPKFADQTHNDLHLLAGSPAIDAGTSVGAPAYDLEGVSRPQGAGFDMGAYEYAVPSNQPPIANAGADVTVEQMTPTGTVVQLDGSDSSDPDGDALTYTWTWGTDGLATGVSPTIDFPVGETTVTLVVNDGTDDSTADTVTITVNAATIEGLESLIGAEAQAGDIDPQLENSLQAKVDAALAALAKDTPNSAKVAVNNLRALINEVEAQTGKKITPEAAAAIIAKANAIIAALEG